ncbi:MAG: amidohydrolase family protein [Spirochaetaceae bacterium]
MGEVKRSIIKNVTTIDESGEVRRAQRVVIAGGVIESVGREPEGPGDTLVKGEATSVDGTGLFLSPSLVNLHTHLPMNILKGIAEDVSVDDWFNRKIWPYESSMEQEDIVAGVRLGIAECFANGVSAAADHYFSADLICTESLSAGMRLDISPTLFGLAGEYDRQLDGAQEIIEEFNGKEGMIRTRLGPHAPYTCNLEQLKQTAGRAARLGVGAHIHVSESAAQLRESLATHGKTPLALIAESGLLEVPTILAHGVYFTEEDHALLAAAEQVTAAHQAGGSERACAGAGSGAPGSSARGPARSPGSSARGPVMVLCPKTYQKLGTGIGEPLNDLSRWPVTIGTDGAASSNTLSPLEQARLLGLWAKNRSGSGETLPARELWRILMRGHEVLGFGSGRLAVGAAADLILWDLEDPATQPIYDPLSAIVYSSHAGNVDTLWVAGGRVKGKGRVEMDLAALYQEARERVGRLIRRGRGETKLVY